MWKWYVFWTVTSFDGEKDGKSPPIILITSWKIWGSSIQIVWPFFFPDLTILILFYCQKTVVDNFCAWTTKNTTICFRSWSFVKITNFVSLLFDFMNWFSSTILMIRRTGRPGRTYLTKMSFTYLRLTVILTNR